MTDPLGGVPGSLQLPTVEDPQSEQILDQSLEITNTAFSHATGVSIQVPEDF
jgi:hypothetical protein